MPHTRRTSQTHGAPRCFHAELFGFIVGVVSVLVALVVGFAMTSGALSIPWLTQLGGGVLVPTAGWVVIILTLFGVILKASGRFA